MKREGINIKVFRKPREKNHKADMVAKLAASGIAGILMNVFMEVAEAPCTKRMIVSTIKKKEG